MAKDNTSGNKIKLTPKEREIILTMRERNNVFKWLAGSTKFTFLGKTVRYDSGCRVAYRSGLVERVDKKSGYYKLTELGKTIDL